MRRFNIAVVAGFLLFAGQARAQTTINPITTVAGGGTNSDIATKAVIANPSSVAVDGSGNVYTASSYLNQVFKIDLVGNLTVVAGDGSIGFSGDGGAATSASLNVPVGVAVDSSGNVFFSDLSNYRVRRVDAATGIITTVAGNGTQGFGGDGGAATSASLDRPFGLAVDSSGNLFIADTNNNRVRRVDAMSGVITTVAGNGSAGYGADGGPAIDTSVYSPQDLAVDPSGNLFIADSGNQRIRRVDAATGIISTFAGNGTTVFGGDGGPATSAGLYRPAGVDIDSSGNVFVADTGHGRIRRVDAGTGIITTVAGQTNSGFAGDGSLATGARLANPAQVIAWLFFERI